MQRNSGAFASYLRRMVSTGLAMMVVITAIAGAWQPQVVRAAAGEGTATVALGTGTLTNANTATYGSDLSTVQVTVGTLAYLRFKLTVGASHIAASQNNVTLQIPTNLFPTNSFDTNEEAAMTDVNTVGEYFISYTDTSGVTNNAAISFAASASANTGLITIQADQQMDATDIIIVTVAVRDDQNSIVAQTATISVDDTGGNSLVAIGASPTVSTAAADAAASIVVATPTVGGVGNVTVTLTTTVALDANDLIDITFPAFMNVAGVASAVTGTLENGGEITCTPSGQTVSCIVISGSPLTTSATIIMTGITSSYAGTTDVSVLEIENEGTPEYDIASDSSVALTDIAAAALTSTDMSLASTRTAVTTNATVTFTLINALAANGKIKVTFPAGFNVASASGATCSTMDGSFATGVSGQVVTITRSGGTSEPAGAQTCTISTIINPVAAGSGGTYTISSTNSTDGVLDTDAAVTADTFVASGGGGGGGGSPVALTYSVDITAPGATDAFMPNDAVDILWTASGTGSFRFVNLSYSTDGGETSTIITTDTLNDGVYNWTVPEVASENVTITVEGTDMVTVLATDTSSTFSIGESEDEDGEGDTEVPDVDTGVDSSELLPVGTFFKGESWTTVYYVDADGTRRPFLDSQTFFTYADDFDAVVNTSDEYLANYAIGTPMLPKAGTVLVKIQSVANVYALGADNELRWLTSEEVANDLYGSSWADYVIDVPVTAWSQFTFGADIDSADDVAVDLSIMETRDAINSK